MNEKRDTNAKLPTGSEMGNDYSKAEGVVCRTPFIYCDGVVTN